MISSWFFFVAVTGFLMAAGVAGCTRRLSDQVLLDNGATIDARDDDGNTALLNAVAGGALPVADVVGLLLTRKASVNARNTHGDTALGLAVKNGQTDAARLLRQAMGKEAAR